MDRGRSFEMNIPIQYLINLHSQYGKLLDEMKDNGTRIMKYDWANFGYSSEVDKDIKELKIEKNPLVEGNYDEIHEKAKESFDSDHKLDMDPLGDVE
ncbi:deoxyguanosine kinase-like isoform X2 [Xenia sp. Carnegie-2017]|nr:deoxyguanosine kinase-like isoform X2 [Xenia sp. Carnegie-2017]